jgi:hypothetical protein
MNTFTDDQQMSLRIYISSTFEDLKEHRRRVYDQLRALRHDVIAMEDYVAADERPLDKCLRDVRESDIYVGLFAWRYGFVPRARNPKRKSVTELEYLEAKANKKPCLIFLTDEKAPWPPDQMDSTTGDNDRGRRIIALRQSLQDNEIIASFETPEALATKVVTSLYSWQTENSRAQSEAAQTVVDEVAAADVRPTAERGFRELWMPGSRLRVRFIGIEPGFAARLMRLAQIWTAYANIRFVHSDDEDAEVRVAFKSPASWSFIATDCLKVPPTEPTVDLGRLHPASPIGDLESVVLHEFGHVLGLYHEHQNPSAEIPWDKKMVIKYFGGPPNNWGKGSIETSIYSRYPQDFFPFSKPFDPLSIMAWYFPPELTSRKKIFRQNLTLSAGDKEFISRLYPYARTS